MNSQSGGTTFDDLSERIQDLIITTTAQGADTLEVHLIDPYLLLFESKFIQADVSGYLWPPIDVNFPSGTDCIWRLCQAKFTNELTGANLDPDIRGSHRVAAAGSAARRTAASGRASRIRRSAGSSRSSWTTRTTRSADAEDPAAAADRPAGPELHGADHKHAEVGDNRKASHEPEPEPARTHVGAAGGRDGVDNLVAEGIPGSERWVYNISGCGAADGQDWYTAQGENTNPTGLNPTGTERRQAGSHRARAVSTPMANLTVRAGVHVWADHVH